jgi:MerR family transcriptional regulator, redox-sensitive transcriptional activator SoxR
MRTDGEGRELSVGEMSRRAGVPASTLHFYEAQGLITSSRTRGNQRRYRRSALRLIAVIKVAQRTGIPLAQIRERLAAFSPDRPLTKADWASVSTAWRADLNARIELLTRLRDQFDTCIGCGCLSLADCPLRNPDDRAAEKGAGAAAFNLAHARPRKADET